MGKFIRENITVKRIHQKKTKYGPMEERLTITIECVSSGDTTKVTNEQLLDKIIRLFGEQI